MTEIIPNRTVIDNIASLDELDLGSITQGMKPEELVEKVDDLLKALWLANLTEIALAICEVAKDIRYEFDTTLSFVHVEPNDDETAFTFSDAFDANGKFLKEFESDFIYIASGLDFKDIVQLFCEEAPDGQIEAHVYLAEDFLAKHF